MPYSLVDLPRLDCSYKCHIILLKIKDLTLGLQIALVFKAVDL